MAFHSDKPADSDEIRLGAGQIRENFNAVVNDGIVVAKPPIYGEGTPLDSIGANFERYVDTLTGDEYVKENGVWLQHTDLSDVYAVRHELASLAKNITNIEANIEEAVNEGIVIAKPAIYGDGAPTNDIGVRFERYVDTLTGDDYVKKDGKWFRLVALSDIYATKDELTALAEDVAESVIAGGGTGGNAETYTCSMFPGNGITNQGSFYWKDSSGHVTVMVRFNSSIGSGITMTGTAAIVMPVGFRPTVTCYAPCFAENPSWSTVAVKNGYMYIDPGGYIQVRFPVVSFKGNDFVCGQISYYAG